MDKRELRSREIGTGNALTGLDQAEAAECGEGEFPGEGRNYTLAAYIVNTVDTAREEHVSAEDAVKQFLVTMFDHEWQFLTVYLVTSGIGTRHDVAKVHSLSGASRAVDRLDKRWERFEELDHAAPDHNAFDVLADNDPLKHYEGCDIYAESANGDKVWMLDPSGEWELIS